MAHVPNVVSSHTALLQWTRLTHQPCRSVCVVSASPLQIAERIFLLKIWILPVLVRLAKGYFPTDSVIRQVKLVYRAVLRLHNWGLFFPIMSNSPSRFGLAPPDVFLWHPFAHPYVKAVVQPDTFTASVNHDFRA